MPLKCSGTVATITLIRTLAPSFQIPPSGLCECKASKQDAMQKKPVLLPPAFVTVAFCCAL